MEDLNSLKKSMRSGKLVSPKKIEVEGPVRRFMNSPHLGNREFHLKAVELRVRFVIPRTEKRGTLNYLMQANRAEVLIVPALPYGRILYREFSHESDESRIRKAIDSREPRKLKYVERGLAEVVEDLYLRGADEGWKELGPWLASQSKVPDIEQSPNIVPAISEEPPDSEVEPGPNGPNVLTEPGWKSSNVASEKDSKYVRLARAYVEWVEKLPEDDLFRRFRHGRRGERPKEALRHFLSDHFPDPEDKIHEDTASVKIGKGLTEVPELRSRLNLKIDYARNAE